MKSETSDTTLGTELNEEDLSGVWGGALPDLNLLSPLVPPPPAPTIQDYWRARGYDVLPDAGGHQLVPVPPVHVPENPTPSLRFDTDNSAEILEHTRDVRGR